MMVECTVNGDNIQQTDNRFKDSLQHSHRRFPCRFNIDHPNRALAPKLALEGASASELAGID